jgi:predicted PurR-regulated permease PerM
LFFIGVLSKEAHDLYLMAKNAVFKEKIQTLLEQTALLQRTNMLLSDFSIQISAEQLKDAISELGKIVGMFLYKQASGVASNLLKFLVNFFFMILIVYFLLIDIRKLINFIKDLSPLRKEETRQLMIKFKNMAAAILIGNGLGGIIQGVLGGALFAIFGLESPVLWGVIMGLLAFMPILGIGMVFIPVAAYFFLIGKATSGLLFLIFYIVISGGMEYIFKPKIVGDRVQLHPLMVFLSVIGGLKLFGILGIIYGPLFITAFLTLTSIYHSNYKRFITT